MLPGVSEITAPFKCLFKSYRFTLGGRCVRRKRQDCTICLLGGFCSLILVVFLNCQQYYDHLPPPQKKKVIALGISAVTPAMGWTRNTPSDDPWISAENWAAVAAVTEFWRWLLQVVHGRTQLLLGSTFDVATDVSTHTNDQVLEEGGGPNEAAPRFRTCLSMSEDDCTWSSTDWKWGLNSPSELMGPFSSSFHLFRDGEGEAKPHLTA